MEPITIDFETMPIVGNPLLHPPLPIGVAVWGGGEDPWYEELDPTRKPGEEPDLTYSIDLQLVAFLQAAWNDEPQSLLYHNAPFDLSVARAWIGGCDYPSWERVHDTMYLSFLDNPYGAVGLKPTAERVLGMPPDEQDELHEWILANVPEATPKTAGAFIYCAPLDLVRKYAIGDVVRTRRIFDVLMEKLDYGQ